MAAVGRRVKTTCATCQREIDMPASQRRKYCSRACTARRPTQSKTCVKCGGTYRPGSARQLICYECTPDRAQRLRLRRYGLTQTEWEELRARFDGLCWICKTSLATCVDHDHETGDVRGALCRVCNMVLPYVESSTWWGSAMHYLRERG